MKRRGLAALVALVATAGVCPLAAGSPGSAEAPALKKQQFLQEKQSRQVDKPTDRDRWHQHLQRRIGRDPKPVINIYNLWTHETLPINANESADNIPQLTIDRFFRCRWTNRTTDMDPALFRTLVEASNHFDVRKVYVISGFRSPKFNLMLRKKGHQVGRESQHTFGKAVDFRLPGVPTSRLRKWARTLGLGGVGFYPKSRMIHIDTARVRYWEGD